MAKIPTHQEFLKTYLPFGIAVILLIIFAKYVPWAQVLHRLAHVSVLVLVTLSVLAIVYYAGKIVRFWLMLRYLGISVGLNSVSLSYMAAQPVSLLPAGELYRNNLIEKTTGTPMARTVPTFLGQGLLEGITLTGLSLIGVLFLGHHRWPVLLAAILIAVATYLLRSDFLGRHAGLFTEINHLPLVSVTREQIKKFSERHQALLRLRPFLILLAVSLVSELAGAGVVLVAVRSLGGHINAFQAMIAYSVPIVVGFVALVPGGLGGFEQATTGLLLLFGVPLYIAAASTLLIRLFLLVGGQVLGLACLGVLAVGQHHPATARAKSS